MANVLDPNAWRALIPAHLTPPQLLLAGQEFISNRASSAPCPGDDAGLVTLARVVRVLFDDQRDRVIWDLPTIPLDSAWAGAISDLPASSDERAEREPWLVLVSPTCDVALGEDANQVRLALEKTGRFLLIVCDGVQASEDAGKPANRLAIELGRDQRFQQIGPVAANDLAQLVNAMESIKQTGRPTLLHVDALGVPRPAQESLPASAIRAEQPDSFLAIAAQELARRARTDTRIMAITSSAEADALPEWQRMPEQMLRVETGQAHALQWCARAALEGNRPFAFISLEELQNNLSQVRREICLNRAPVTLIVDPRSVQAGARDSSSASLAAIRQLPDTPLLSPKDGTELKQMIDWCLARHDPAVIWLPQPVEPQFAWDRGPEIMAGKAEQLTAGGHVAIVAWGPMVAAACAAARGLMESGIEAAVVNARFALPMDSDSIVSIARDALCVVVVDDGDSSGGFGMWVVEHLLRAGIAQPVTIVSPPAGAGSQHPHDVHKQCALQIVDRCRWLAEPLTPKDAIEQACNVPVVADRTDALGWLEPFGMAGSGLVDEHRQVLAYQLSPFIDQWVGRYAKVGSRGVYLWRWCLHGLELTTLSCVSPALRQELCETKLLAVMYGVMLDDVADQGGDEDYLRELTKIISGVEPPDFGRFSLLEQQYAAFTLDLWQTFIDRLKRSAFFEEYEELLHYDHCQILNTMAYSAMVNRYPAMLNVQEHDMYLPHNMQMMSFATMDLMNSPSFDRRELGKLREIVWHAQAMGRIGNLVSTWQREVGDRDFTSGVFARAVLQGDITLDDLRLAPPKAIETAIRRGAHELHFLQQWEAHRRAIESMRPFLHSVDVDALLTALDRLIHMELGSRGHK